jgi:hypothetical protein
MESDSFAKRERALEDEFFHRVDQKLREELRKSMEHDRTREALVAATGFQDSPLLDELVDSGITATTLVALALVPSVMVAWSDADVDKKEREAIMEIAQGRGIDQGGPAYEVLSGWLAERPDRSLLETWKHYVSEVKPTLTEEAWKQFAHEVVEQATAVAHASGGLLGYGTVSVTEKNIIDQIREAVAL